MPEMLIETVIKKKELQQPPYETHITIIEMRGSSNYRNKYKTLIA